MTAPPPSTRPPRPRPTAYLTASACALLLATSAPAGAAEQPLTLMQAIEYAVKSNPDLRRERIAIDVADAQLEASRGAFDFLLTSDLIFSRRTTPAINSQDVQGGVNNNLLLNLGLARQLETGGAVSLNFRNNQSDTNNRLQCGTLAGAATDCTIYGSDVNLSFNHPLLQGFGSEIAQANIRRERIQKDQALLNRQMQAANVVRDVINTYWGLSYATQDLAIRRSAVDLANEQLRVTKAQIDVGRLAPVDAAAVERAIGERMQEVLVSEQELLFRTLELRRLFGQGGDPSMQVYGANDAPQSTAREVDVPGEIGRAMESNPQLRAIKLGMALTEVDLQVARSTLKPRLDFVGEVGATGRRPDLPDAIAQAFGLDELTWSAGLQFEMPLENRQARGQERAARLASELSRLNAGDLELEIRNQVVRLSSVIRTAAKRVDLAKATVGFATQNLEAEKARFSVGRSTNNDVLLRQQELKNTEIQVVRATVDLLVGENTLAALTGELLDRYKIVLKGM